MSASGCWCPPRGALRQYHADDHVQSDAREAARIRQLARREGLTVSEFFRRRAVTPSPETAGSYRITVDAVTGLPLMEAPPGTLAVSSAQIRALLSDFP